MALHAFSHSNVKLHDYEISLGADKALCLKLGYAVVTNSKPAQIVLLCQCLVKVYQCSSECRQESFRQIGATELVPLLAQIWKQQVIRVDDNYGGFEAMLLSTVSVLRVFAKLDAHAKSFLIRYEKGALVASFLQMISSFYERGGQSQFSCESSPALYLELFSMMKDLTFRCHALDKKYLWELHGGILKRVLFCWSGFLVSSTKLAEMVTAILWNLVLDPEICIDLLQYNGETSLDIFQTLTRMLSTTSETTKSEQPTTKAKRNAISALGNLLATPQNQTVLFQKDTQFQIVPILIQLVEQDPDSIIRRRAMRTLRCLASVTTVASKDGKEQSTCCLDVLLESDIVRFLVNTIARDGGSQDDENDKDTQIQACLTVGSLLEAFWATDWPLLETALIQRIETTTDAKLTLAACKCLLLCVTKSPWRRGPSCFSDMFWKRIDTVVTGCNETHGCIAKLLLEVAREAQKGSSSPTAAAAAAAAAPNRTSTLACVTVVNTLTSLLSEFGPDFEDSRDDALEVVLILKENENNKRPLAEHEGLLTALVNLCILESGPKKDLAKQAILDLVPEL